MKRLPRTGLETLQREQYYKEDCSVKSKKEAEAVREEMLSSCYVPRG